MVIWITGLAGSGKTTIGREVARRLKARRANVVFLDGDEVRELFGNDLGHDLQDRLENAKRMSRLCKVLAEQGLDVVCATMSFFHECHRWNRAHLQDYFEVYLQVAMEELIRRDPKQLYSRALRGEISNVVGIDLECHPPTQPDLTLDTTTGRETVDEFAARIVLEVETRWPKLSAL